MMKNNQQSGFAMLFTVLIVSLILSITISISNITLRQAVLSNLAKDSGVAFYQADAAVECGMFEDTNGKFPQVKAGDIFNAPSTFDCGDNKMNLDQSSSVINKYVYKINSLKNSSSSCFSIVFDKTDPKISKVQGMGFNICKDSPRRVERTLEVRY